MATGKQRSRETVQQPTPPTHDEADMEQEEEDEDSDIEVNLGGELERDETEEELERLVFGDSAGFREGLKEFSLGDDEADEQHGANGLAGLEDADVGWTCASCRLRKCIDQTQIFSYDVTGGMEAATLMDSDKDEPVRYRRPAAWEDSDDERMVVSLASVPRLRKLRLSEAEDVVNGKEYGKRLRRQFELLNPRPEWAQHVMQKPARKKRRLSGEEDDSAEMDASDEDMDLGDDENTLSAAPLAKVLRNAEFLVRQSGPANGKKRKIRPEVIDIQRAKDVPGVQPSSITSLSFHPRYPLLLSSGPSSTLYLHHIVSSPPAPTSNPLLTSLHVSGTQLTTTAFNGTDSRIFLSGRRRYFHVWNLETGTVEKIHREQHEQRTMEKFKLSPDGSYMALLGSTRKNGGVLNILSATTLQWVGQVRIESRGGIADFAWWRDGAGLCIAGKNGEVTEWSAQSQSVIARWQDEGAVGTGVIALGGQHNYKKSAIGTDRWIAIGSSSGITNIYDRSKWVLPSPHRNTAAAIQANPNSITSTPGDSSPPIPTQPKPTKILDHLTTPITTLTFSPDGQILAMSSMWKSNSLRLVHLPSCTVFQNWPTSTTGMGRITGTAFCGGDVLDVGEDGKASGDVFAMLAVANERGQIKLWEIR